MKTRYSNKIQTIINAWESLAPAKSFAGMTLEEFKAVVKLVSDLQNSQGLLDRQVVEAAKLLKDRSDSALETALRVVSAVKADPEHGRNSPLYAAMGYVRKSDRSSGLTRKVVNMTTSAQPLLKAA